MTMIDSSHDQPTPSETAFQSPKKADAAPHYPISYIPVYSSDEEDDSRDRQSHWKRIKTRSDDTTSNGRSLIKWAEPRYETSPVRRPLQTLISRIPSPKKSLNPKKILNNPPGHRVITLKSRLHDGGHGLDVVTKDGGTASSQAMIMEAGAASKRKFEPEHRMISMNIDMYERMREHQQMARRLPGTAGRFEVRVREEGEFYDEDEEDEEDDSSLFLEDSNPRPNITVDLREALNRRSRPLVANRENKGYGGDGDGHELGFDVKVRVRRVDFDLSCASERSEVRKKVVPLPPSDVAQRLRIGAAVGSHKGSESDTEAERRRERWAEKERDLERDLQKELQKQALQKQELQKQQQLQLLQQQSMATTAQQPKSVTVVDYSHKFTVAKAPLGIPVKPVESDPHRLCQRQKQIDYGKNTLGYERYTEMVPRYQRTKVHPRTPDIRQVCSKRSWDGQIRKWRRLLHEYDPPKGEDDEDPDQMFVPTREHDGIRGSAADDCMMDVQSELVEDADLKIYDGWSDEEC